MGRRLTQQWIVDSYVKIEKDRLKYDQDHQSKLRAESYQGLLDHLQSQLNNDASRRIGKVIILSSTFTSSPRNMLQHYQNAMAIVRKFLKDNLFGKVVAYNWVIEFQKRGLPHLHMLITLDNISKMSTPKRVNKFICAEIPDKNENPTLHNIVTTNMLHGPCEVVSTVSAVKHLYKYVYKGHDKAGITINGQLQTRLMSSVPESNGQSSKQSESYSIINHDEIKNFVDTRYVGPVEGRMYSVSPAQSELFHLRILLLHSKGARNYEELRTVNGVIHNTFTETCLAAELIEDDDEWKRTLNEAVIWMMPRQLRCLFVRILIHCKPLHPNELWNKFKEAMSEDLTKRLGSSERGQKKTYIFINSMLHREGYSLASFSSMPQINEIENIDVTEQDVLPESANHSNYDKLNIHQKEVVHYVLSIVDNYHNNDVHTTLLPSGKTVHKTFGLPVPLFSDSSSNVKPNSKHGIYLSNVDVFIWDEAPMSPRYALEIDNRTLQDIMNNDIPFGGKIMILGGDFRQLLQNMRALPQETEFVQFLLDVGNGKINDIDDKLVLPNQCLVSTRNNIVTDVYQGIIRGKRYHELTGTAILSARNIDVDAINQEVIELLDISTEKYIQQLIVLKIATMELLMTLL
ncbi:uncharacterized protein LOC123274271 [Cotesia glomerata]|uniref:uncharacterized protein LOC123274271 n=1 Tax=Cotesia glomerata TaxID=32391 RepID=UPI001D0231EF|nr:uncharacterized protein LOC123274271 [Cotesia glomerata]